MRASPDAHEQRATSNEQTTGTAGLVQIGLGAFYKVVSGQLHLFPYAISLYHHGLSQCCKHFDISDVACSECSFHQRALPTYLDHLHILQSTQTDGRELSNASHHEPRHLEALPRWYAQRTKANSAKLECARVFFVHRREHDVPCGLIPQPHPPPFVTAINCSSLQPIAISAASQCLSSGQQPSARLLSHAPPARPSALPSLFARASSAGPMPAVTATARPRAAMSHGESTQKPAVLFE